VSKEGVDEGTADERDGAIAYGGDVRVGLEEKRERLADSTCFVIAKI
jgi:hypothetical protein